MITLSLKTASYNFVCAQGAVNATRHPADRLGSAIPPPIPCCNPCSAPNTLLLYHCLRNLGLTEADDRRDHGTSARARDAGNYGGLRAFHCNGACAAVSARVEPTDYNYPVALKGAWHSGRYRFLTEYKCGGTNRTAEGFETPYVRLDYIARNRFRLHWMRHTGKWTPAPFGPLPLDEALGYIASEPYLQPHC